MSGVAIAGLALACCGADVARSETAVETNGATACTIAGWSGDSDPAGLNVRAAPRLDAAVIARVPPPDNQDGDSYAAEFRVVGSRGGWLLVKDVTVVDYGSGKGDRLVFAGPGWVFGDKVRFSINRPELRQAPKADAAVLGRLRSRDGASGPDAATIDHVHGCAGAFAEVTAHMTGEPPRRGWVTGICSNQVTTCP
ncbi:MAG: hypothetical protein AB1586_29200 [Pseudomonadota bacterium]|jgi:hypothetical protein